VIVAVQLFQTRIVASTVTEIPAAMDPLYILQSLLL